MDADPADDAPDVVLPLVGEVDDELTAGLCRVVGALLEDDGTERITCDVARAGVDLRLVDALARMHLTARGVGCGIRIRGAGAELRLLVELIGLTDVLPVDPDGPGSADDGG